MVTVINKYIYIYIYIYRDSEAPRDILVSWLFLAPHPLMSAAAAVATRRLSAFSERHGVDLESGRAYPRSKLFELITEILEVVTRCRCADNRATSEVCIFKGHLRKYDFILNLLG